MATPDPAAANTNPVPDNGIPSATLALYRAVIGPIGVDYYLPIFTRFEAVGRTGPSWNWSACLYTLNWLLLRHLWRAALVYAALLLSSIALTFALGTVWLDLASAQMINLALVPVAFFFVLPGIFGNALLHAACRKKMDQALLAAKTLTQACAMLEGEASSRRDFVWLALANVVLAVTLATTCLLRLAGSTPVPASAAPVLGQGAAGNIGQSASTAASAPLAPVQLASDVAWAAPLPAQPVSDGASAPLVPSSSVAAPIAAAQSKPTASAARSPRPTAVLTPPSAPASLRYYVNVGLFAQAANAQRAHARLIAAGMPAVRQTVQSRQGMLTRVQVGPLGTRAQAQDAAEKIHSLQLDAVVIEQ